MLSWNPQQFTREAKKEGCSQPLINAAIQTASLIKKVDIGLPVIFTLSHLAQITDTPLVKLGAYSRRTSKNSYRVFRLKKADRRKFRVICVPEPTLMHVQRWLAQNVFQTRAAAPHQASYAYYSDPRRGLLNAAKQHAGCLWLIKMDIQNFFGSIMEPQVYKVFRDLGYGALLSFQLARICTYVGDKPSPRRKKSYGIPNSYCENLGYLPQGAPTSPALANLTTRLLDSELEKLAQENGWRYSRYADDIAFSTTQTINREVAKSLVFLVREKLINFGFTPNDTKTVISPPGARRIVLGLLVDGPYPRLTNDFRNNLDTHLYALLSKKIGVKKHQEKRGFDSVTGMRRHIMGLLAHAHSIDREYSRKCYEKFNKIIW
ncbi:reverse transcriptase family protein [Gluconacetobacter takamatsuzukensis]|uniref:RNA-directed DNA polymerase n=1 Tax=Gluconacetobacter takamatsuzukensis TaxID=1286190 RepID=A0A7W4PMV9_9PROT|nr:reverse transcriptase family protein [Gluconacetobacter takamatsuzukensis]MBB2203977.1 RNA-directed DNA polymerase [Gluconacetobacter takamatsuzukensis]